MSFKKQIILSWNQFFFFLGGGVNQVKLSGFIKPLCSSLPQQPTEYFDMGIFLAFFVVVSLVCLILLIKIKLKQRRSQVTAPAFESERA